MNLPPTAPLTPSTTSLVLDAEALYRELLRGVRSLMGPANAAGGHHLGRCLVGRALAPGFRLGPAGQRAVFGAAP